MSIAAHLTFGKSISLNPELKNPTRLARHRQTCHLNLPVKDSNLDAHAYVVSALPTKPSPHPRTEHGDALSPHRSAFPWDSNSALSPQKQGI